MLECIVLQFIMGYNPVTTESKLLYRCEGKKYFQYVESHKKVRGVYSIEADVVVLEENYGL